MRVFNTLLQVVVMKLLSSSKSRVFARVRVCCVYLQMRVEIYEERGLKIFQLCFNISFDWGSYTKIRERKYSLSLSTTIYTTTTTTL